MDNKNSTVLAELRKKLEDGKKLTRSQKFQLMNLSRLDCQNKLVDSLNDSIKSEQKDSDTMPPEDEHRQFKEDWLDGLE